MQPPHPSRYDRLAGAAALGMAATYVLGFAYFGAFWAFPAEAPPTDRMAYLAEHRVSVSLAYAAIYLAFGVLLSVLVVRLHERAAHASATLTRIAALFGAVWVGLVIASGMLLTTGVRSAVALAETDAARAAEVWDTVALLAESIGGGNEMVGGLWVVLSSAVCQQQRLFSTRLNGLGFFVGAAGLATLYPSEVLPAVFGLAQIGWFVGVGRALLRPPVPHLDPVPRPDATALSGVAPLAPSSP